MNLPGPKKHSRPHTRAAMFFLGMATFFYSPLLLGLRTFPDGDFTHHFLPFSLFQQSELLSGRLPLWNPYTYSGHPFVADTQAAIFYPISLLVMLISYPLTGFFDSAAAARLYFLQVEVVLHVALAGFFTYLLVDGLTRRRASALLAGILFAFSGYLTSYPPQQLAVLRSAIWLPLILYFLYRALEQTEERSRRDGWWFGFILATTTSFLAGHPQTMLHIGYLGAGWVLLLLSNRWRVEQKGRGWIGLSLSLLLSLCAIAGLSAAQLLPSLEFTRLSVRAETSYDFLSAGFPLRDTWQLILPGVFTWFSPLYIGVAGLGLVLVALGYFGREGENQPTGPEAKQPTSRLVQPSWAVSQRFVLFFVLVTLIALLLSYGRNGFLYPLFYRLAPGWDLFRQQERAAFLVSFGLSIVAGLGFAALLRIPLKRRRLLAGLYAVLVIGSVYSFGLLWQLSGDSVLSNWGYIGVAMGTLVAVMLFAVMLWWEGWDQRRSRIIMGLVILNLFIANMGTNLTPFGPDRKTLLAPEMEALQAAVAERGNTDGGLPGRVYNEFRVYEDYGMRLGVADVWGSSPLKLAAYASLFEDFPLDRMWQLTGVEHVLTWRRELFEPSSLLAEFPQSADTTYLHRLSVPNPRAWVVPTVHLVNEGDVAGVVGLLADHTFDLEQTALVFDPTGTAPMIGTGSGIGHAATMPPSDATIQLSQRRPGYLLVTVQSEQGGYLVISENFMPGLRVVNFIPPSNPPPPGLPPYYQVNRTNLAFVGLTIPPGETTFELIYDPASVRIGLWVSGLTLLVLAGVGVGARFFR